MTQPLAVLNDEEMHWLNDLGLPNQRRWLNHRNSVTNTAERFPPPRRIVTDPATKRHIRLKKDFLFYGFCFVTYVPFVANLKSVCPRRPARVRDCCEPSKGDRASRHIRRCARQVASLPARACS